MPPESYARYHGPERRGDYNGTLANIKRLQERWSPVLWLGALMAAVISGYFFWTNGIKEAQRSQTVMLQTMQKLVRSDSIQNIYIGQLRKRDAIKAYNDCKTIVKVAKILTEPVLECHKIIHEVELGQ